MKTSELWRLCRKPSAEASGPHENEERGFQARAGGGSVRAPGRDVVCKPDGSQLMQRDILKCSLHAILKKLGLEQGGLNIFRRFRITKLETAEVPAALQHTWSGHAKSHVSEVYKKLQKQRE